MPERNSAGDKFTSLVGKPIKAFLFAKFAFKNKAG
jgi:hypothetical protein